MDQTGTSSEQGDSNFNLYDAYGTGMDVDGSTVEGVFPMGGWDHQPQSVETVGYPDITTQGGGYDPSTTTMADFDPTHYGNEFQHDHAFDPGNQQFHGFMGHDAISDQHGDNEAYDLNAMDLYHATSIYPNLAQETSDYGTLVREYWLYSDI